MAKRCQVEKKYEVLQERLEQNEDYQNLKKEIDQAEAKVLQKAEKKDVNALTDLLAEELIIHQEAFYNLGVEHGFVLARKLMEEEEGTSTD